MDTPFAKTPVTGSMTGEAEEKIVYVREVLVENLPRAVQEAVQDAAQDRAEGYDVLYSVHDEEGQRLALVAERDLAFSLAREHDFSPVSVH